MRPTTVMWPGWSARPRAATDSCLHADASQAPSPAEARADVLDALDFLLGGRYRLLERVGEGGMGIVWRCLDLDLDETVAIKFLREDLATDPLLRGYFRRETRLARRVTHRNVARVYEFGHIDELYYLTMEFIVGESLFARLSRCGRCSPAWVLQLAAGLCRGLAAALAVGVVHGDIKPGNILLAPGRGGVITDFGIARVLGEPLTGDECTGGTPQYMAPELARSRPITPQSDVYALGCVLFEALTGRNPWPTTDPPALLELKVNGYEPDLRRLAPGLHVGWLELLTDCLRAEADRRPRDVRAVLLRLTALRGAL